MNLKAKRHVEEQKKKAREKLATRMELLNGKGMDPKRVAKDSYVRKLRADIRKADYRLCRVAAVEALNSRKIQQKQEKIMAGKQAKEAGQDNSAKKKAPQSDKKKKTAKDKK